jgi:hypothetical protein
MKRLKFQPGTFLEVAAPGGRAVAVVCGDGLSCSLTADGSTAPMSIHPALAPVSLGTASGFVEQRGLRAAATYVVERLLETLHPQRDDSLFVFRVLHALSAQGQGEGWKPTWDQVEAAIDEAQSQADDEEALFSGAVHILAAQAAATAAR